MKNKIELLNKSSYDILIVGGGLVGSVLALKLAQANFQVLLIEKIPPQLNRKHKVPDLFVSAINYSSVQLLRDIKVWDHINKNFLKSYCRLEVWEWPHSMVTFDSKLLNLQELGCIIENWRLRYVLWQTLKEHKKIVLCCPSFIRTMQYYENHWCVLLDNNVIIYTKLLVGADGANSQLRKQLGIKIISGKYNQDCIIFSVETQKNVFNDTTWQIFTPSGPKAYLPMYNHWASLIWYDSISHIKKLQKLSISALEKEIHINFPNKLGKIKLRDFLSFSLSHCYTRQYVQQGLIIIGDAAHTIHPMAGQGINLGFKDVKILAEILINAYHSNESWNTLSVLNRYQRCRLYDNLLMQTGIDALYLLFNNNIQSLKIIRNFGLICVQHINYLKKIILKYALGLN